MAIVVERYEVTSYRCWSTEDCLDCVAKAACLDYAEQLTELANVESCWDQDFEGPRLPENASGNVAMVTSAENRVRLIEVEFVAVAVCFDTPAAACHVDEFACERHLNVSEG